MRLEGARRCASGFTLVELGAVVAILGLLLGVLMATLPESRREERLALCVSRMKQFGAATHSYAADFHERMLSFTWTNGSQLQSRYADIRNFWAGNNDLQSAALQAVDIIRRWTGLDEAQAPLITAWIPHVMYTPLVLVDYAGGELPDKRAACPEDKYRQLWQMDPLGFRNGVFLPYQPSGTGSGWRWPYSSSYEFNVFTYSNDRGDTGAPVVVQSDTHNTYALVGQSGPGALGRRKITHVAFPSLKTLANDLAARHYGRRWWYATHPEARQPILFFDGSVVSRQTTFSNPGADPRNPSSPNSITIYNYEPGRWEAPKRSGGRNPSLDQYVVGHFRWTRMGLKGVDFPGGPVVWTQGVRVKTEIYP